MLTTVKATAARLHFAPALTATARLACEDLRAKGSSGLPPAKAPGCSMASVIDGVRHRDTDTILISCVLYEGYFNSTESPPLIVLSSCLRLLMENRTCSTKKSIQ